MRRLVFNLEPDWKTSSSSMDVAEIATNIHMMKLAVYKAAVAIQENDDYIRQAAFMKMYAMKASQDAGMNAVQTTEAPDIAEKTRLRDISEIFEVHSILKMQMNILKNNCRQLIKITIK